MISVNDFRTGLTIEVDNGIWRVLDFQHVKPGKGAKFSFAQSFVTFVLERSRKKHSALVRK